MNWGTKLVIGMGTFMAFIVTLGFLMFSSKTDALIENDYYQKGLQYDSTYLKKEQVKTDAATPEIAINQDLLTITFKAPATGNLILIRNSDKKMDRSVKINTGNLHMVNIPLTAFAKGQWRIQLSWTSNGKSYLFEDEIKY